MKLTIRAATPSDQPFIRELFFSLKKREWSSAGLEDATLDRLLEMQFNAQSQSYAESYPGSVCMIIDLDARPVGRVWLHRSAERIHILDIGVVPSMQGLGIGAGTLSRILSGAAAAPVTLQVAQDNPAQRLYRKLGFEVTAECPPYLQMQWRRRDASATGAWQ